MDTPPPSNKLLQLLKQKPALPAVEPSSGQSQSLHTKPRRKSSSKSGTQPATFSGIQGATSSIQPATSDDTQGATKRNTQGATSGIQPTTKSGIPFTLIGLSKGQNSVWRFLQSVLDLQYPYQTTPVGYDIIARAGSPVSICF